MLRRVPLAAVLAIDLLLQQAPAQGTAGHRAAVDGPWLAPQRSQRLFDEVDVELGASLLLTKTHFKNGAPGAPGNGLLPPVSGTEHYRFANRLAAATSGADPLFGGDCRLALDVWSVEIDGHGALPPGFKWGGQTVTRLQTAGDFVGLGFEYLHWFQASDSVRLGAGLRIDELLFFGDFESDVSDTSLDFDSTFLTPELAFEWRLSPTIDYSLLVGGFHLPATITGAQIGDNEQVTTSLRFHGEHWQFEAGFHLFSVDLTEHANSAAEDFLHTRLQGPFLQLVVRF